MDDGNRTHDAPINIWQILAVEVITLYEFLCHTISIPFEQASQWLPHLPQHSNNRQVTQWLRHLCRSGVLEERKYIEHSGWGYIISNNNILVDIHKWKWHIFCRKILAAASLLIVHLFVSMVNIWIFLLSTKFHLSVVSDVERWHKSFFTACQCQAANV